METLSNIRQNTLLKMKIDVLDAIIKTLTGLSGGAIAIWLLVTDSEDKSNKEGIPVISKKNATFFLIFGFCGAFFIAPAINEYFNFTGGIASCISLLCAIFCNSVILLLHKVFKSLIKSSENIAKGLIKRLFGE